MMFSSCEASKSHRFSVLIGRIFTINLFQLSWRPFCPSPRRNLRTQAHHAVDRKQSFSTFADQVGRHYLYSHNVNAVKQPGVLLVPACEVGLFLSCCATVNGQVK